MLYNGWKLIKIKQKNFENCEKLKNDSTEMGEDWLKI